MKIQGLLGALVALPLSLAAVPANATPVDLELQLLVDVSGSVDAGEFNDQRSGYSAAFRDSDIINQIMTYGTYHSIAVQLIYWSQGQSIGVDWTLINDSASSNAFADAIDAAGRPGGIGTYTGTGSAINFGLTELTNEYEGDRLVMDVSGDGSENVGANTDAARNSAVSAGVTINGLPILGSESNLDAWYAAHIVSADGFLVIANGFSDFANAVKRKIGYEITGGMPEVPVPGAIPLMLTGLGLLWGRVRRNKKQA